MRLESCGSIFAATFDDAGCTLRFSRLRELPSGDYRGLVELLEGDVLRHSSVVNLSTATGRRSVVASLNGSRQNWVSLLDEACAAVCRRLMDGSPSEVICTENIVSPQQYLLDPFLPLKQPTMLFGRPGSTKSFLALLLAVMVQLPHPKNEFGWATGQKATNVLMLDNETSRDTVHRRLQELLRGMGLPPALHIQYKRLFGSLPSEIESIQRTVMDKSIGFVLVDSAGKAVGGDITQAGAVNDFFSAVNQLGVTVLLIHHQPKDDLMRNRSPFGSAYFEANARSVWHIERGEGSEDDFAVMVKHTKSNDSRLHTPIGLRVCFGMTQQGKSVRFRPCELRYTEFADKLPLQDQMEAALLRHPMTPSELADELGKPTSTISPGLSRHKDKFLKLGNGKWRLRIQGEMDDLVL